MLVEELSSAISLHGRTLSWTRTSRRVAICYRLHRLNSQGATWHLGVLDWVSGLRCPDCNISEERPWHPVSSHWEESWPKGHFSPHVSDKLQIVQEGRFMHKASLSPARTMWRSQGQRKTSIRVITDVKIMQTTTSFTVGGRKCGFELRVSSN